MLTPLLLSSNVEHNDKKPAGNIFFKSLVRPGWDLNPQPPDHAVDTLTIRPHKGVWSMEWIKLNTYLQSEQIVDSTDDDIDSGMTTCLGSQVVLEFWNHNK